MVLLAQKTAVLLAMPGCNAIKNEENERLAAGENRKKRSDEAKNSAPTRKASTTTKTAKILQILGIRLYDCKQRFHFGTPISLMTLNNFNTFDQSLSLPLFSMRMQSFMLDI